MSNSLVENTRYTMQFTWRKDVEGKRLILNNPVALYHGRRDDTGNLFLAVASNDTESVALIAIQDRCFLTDGKSVSITNWEGVDVQWIPSHKTPRQLESSRIEYIKRIGGAIII